jgi:hypothetical protein
MYLYSLQIKGDLKKKFAFKKHLTCILLVANSTPIVDFDSKLNSLRVKRDSRLLFPTPESPMSTTANIKITYIMPKVLIR